MALSTVIALAIAPSSMLAEVQVRGNPEAVSIEAQNASVAEILETLSGAFDVRYRSSADLGKRLTGTYRGSLQKVVTRVLNGYDFLVGTGGRGIEITMLGSSAAPPEVKRAKAATPTVATPALTSGAAPVPRQGLLPAPITMLGSSTASPEVTIATGATPTVATPAPTSGAAPVPRQGSSAAPLPAPPFGSMPAPISQPGTLMILTPPVGGMSRPPPGVR